MTTAEADQQALQGDSLEGLLVDEEDHQDKKRKGADKLDALVNKMAAQHLRRLANQHGCTGHRCADPNHRRDANLLQHLLAQFFQEPGQELGTGVPVKPEQVTAADRDAYLRSLRGGGVAVSDKLPQIKPRVIGGKRK